MDEVVLQKLERRLGRLHAQQRLGLESDHEAQILGQGLNFFHIENWYSIHSLIRNTLRVSGLYWRGRRNAERVELRENVVRSAAVPIAFDRFNVLHLTDLHVEMSQPAMYRVAQLVEGLAYDICVLTGDYRTRTFGPFDATLEGLAALRQHLKDPVYAVLGNHDSIGMVPAMEEMGIRILLNESVALTRDQQMLYLAGVDDAHFYRVD